MNDEFAKTIVLENGPAGRAAVTGHDGLPSRSSSGVNDAAESDGPKAPNYPAFEDTSWLT